MKKQEIKEIIEQEFLGVEFEASDRIKLTNDKSISGDTYKIKDVIRQMGGKWDPSNARWNLRSKIKAELIVALANEKIVLIAQQQEQERMAEEAAKEEASIMEVVEEYSMTEEQEQLLRDLVVAGRKNRFKREQPIRRLTQNFLSKLADQRDPEAMLKEEQEKAAKVQAEALRKEQLEEARRTIEESRKRRAEEQLLKQAKTIENTAYFEKITGVDAEELLKQINDALVLVTRAKRKGYMLASDKQIFRAIQLEVGDVINALNAKQYTNAELAQFYDHNDNRLDKIHYSSLCLNQIVSLQAPD